MGVEEYGGGDEVTIEVAVRVVSGGRDPRVMAYGGVIRVTNDGVVRVLEEEVQKCMW